MRRLLLCTDLDRTLVPNGAAPESPGARELFARLAAAPWVTVAYATGRHLDLVEEALQQYRLPRPDVVLADVGATIYEREHDAWQSADAWDEAIAPGWRGLPATHVHDVLRGLPGLALQPPERQRRHKLSYTVPPTADRDAVLSGVEQTLSRAGLHANLVWSLDEAAGVGLLDLLPAGANKRRALEFLMRRRGFDEADTIFAGDSGNDLDVMRSPIRSVLVANASDEVRALATGSPASSRLYLARGGFLGMNGNYSAGILEGLAHFLPEVGRWLADGARG